MTRGRLTECGPSGSQNHGRSKSRRKKNLKCYNCVMRGNVTKECWNNMKNGEKTSKAKLCLSLSWRLGLCTFPLRNVPYKTRIP